MNPLLVITGASRGIGRACALAFAHRGARLALLGRASEGHRQTVRDCEALDAEVFSADCDVSDAAAIERNAAAIVSQLGAPDVVLNNAGLLVRGPRVHELSLQQWQRVMQINVTAPFLFCRAFLPAMLARGSGRFLHMASVSGTIACPNAAAYGSSKWALIGFSKSLAAELRGSGLQSIAILPGSVDTDMLKQTPFPPDMTSADIAELVCYHALDAPAATNGANVEVYG